MSSKMKKIILNALFPPDVACLSCRREAVVDEDGLCSDCRSGLEPFTAAPLPKNIDGYTAAYIYNDVSSRMVIRLKYSNARYMAKYLADAITLPKEWGKIDAVVPVPLYYKREWKRGYNQSELIAKYLCSRYELKLDTSLLIRIKNTKSQTRLSDSVRRINLSRAFAADEACKGTTILLIDDVMTTGSTLEECAAELRRHGTERVYAATVCFAHPDSRW